MFRAGIVTRCVGRVRLSQKGVSRVEVEYLYVRVAIGSRLIMPVQVVLPESFSFDAKVVEIVTGVVAVIVAVVENLLQGVVAYRFDFADGELEFSRLQRFLAGAVATNLR